MGLMATSPKPEKTPLTIKRKSTGIDFGSLAPLSQGSQTRKPAIKEPQPSSQRKNSNAMDSDDEDDEEEDRRPKIKEEEDDNQISRTFLTAEEVLEESKLSDELRKTKVGLESFLHSLRGLAILIEMNSLSAHTPPNQSTRLLPATVTSTPHPTHKVYPHQPSHQQTSRTQTVPPNKPMAQHTPRKTLLPLPQQTVP